MEKSTVKNCVENLDAWKAEHPGRTVKKITVKAKANAKAEFVIAQPTRSMLDSISSYVQDGKPQKVREVMFNGCLLAGDTELFETDLNLQSTVMNKIMDMLDNYETEEKEL